ncbi:MAG: DUF4446 family protein [Candidatus Levybacteria bacterium]|nr:DUF4446 family protein [Candidatus Levybacteria bacterium]
MVFSFELVGLIVSILWLIFLTTLLWQLSSHYNNLTRGISQKTLKSILDHVLTGIEAADKSIVSLKARCDKLEKDGLFHIQKIGLLRFNPFKDTGGDQSFILSLIDANDTGIIITGLYSRSGTRWYAKKVENGKGIEHELSDEEKKAIKEAKSSNG